MGEYPNLVDSSTTNTELTFNAVGLSKEEMRVMFPGGDIRTAIGMAGPIDKQVPKIPEDGVYFFKGILSPAEIELGDGLDTPGVKRVEVVEATVDNGLAGMTDPVYADIVEAGVTVLRISSGNGSETLMTLPTFRQLLLDKRERRNKSRA